MKQASGHLRASPPFTPTVEAPRDTCVVRWPTTQGVTGAWVCNAKAGHLHGQPQSSSAPGRKDEAHRPADRTFVRKS